jgi:hypothetical protein
MDTAGVPAGGVEHIEPPSWSTRRTEWWLAFLIVVVVSGAYMLYYLDRGWIPHDEGTLAHGAERVLSGEMPHRDFVEGYTGGLTYVNALAFRVFGIRLLAIRYVLFLVFIVWIPVCYYAATRFLRPYAAGAVTLTAMFWSVPNYPAAMPSWYNLFLATGGVAALLAYIDAGKVRWLFVAGLCGGFSVLVKVHGLLFVAAGLLFILYHESQREQTEQDARPSSLLSQLAIGAILLAAIVSLLAIGLVRRSWVDLYQFTVPGLAMVTIVVRSIIGVRHRSQSAALAIARGAIPYLVGTALPIAAFVSLYAVADALPDLLRGVALLPTKAAKGASLDPPSPLGLIPMAMAAFLLIRLEGRSKWIAVPQHALGIAIIALGMVPRTALQLEPLVWSAVAESTPITIPLLALAIARSERRRGAWDIRSRLVLLGCAAAFCSLIQYPFAAPIYFSYSFPLLLLAIVALVQEIPRIRTGALVGFMCFLPVFGALYITPMPVPGTRGPVVVEDVALLDLPRAGLWIGRPDAETYPVIVELLREHATSGVIYAGPDAPEVYFLSQLRNPTPAFFDYLIPDSLFHKKLLRRLDSLGVSAVALRRRVVHSPPLEPDIQAAFVTRFPFSREVGRFTIRWR